MTPREARAENGRDFDSSAKWMPCPGCDKCSPTDGYILRQGRFRTTTSHEYIYLFSKSKNYFMDAEACKEIAVGGSPGNKTHKGAIEYANGNEKHRLAVGLADMVAEKRIPRSVWKIAPESYGGSHFACFPSELPKRCIEMATSAAGCCDKCGAQLAPVVSTERVPTRPGNTTKVGRVGVHEESPYHDHAGIICGNRDPQRHLQRSIVAAYWPTCDCKAGTKPCVVGDMFLGTGTTVQVATHYGRDGIGIELNPEYAALAEARIATEPRCLIREREAAGKKTKKVVKVKGQREFLFAGQT